MNDLSAEFICSFLDSIERERRNSARTRNLRLTCIRSFFRYVVMEAPDHAGLAQRILTIPPKRCDRKIVGFLTKKEAAAILSAIDQRSWCGMRDYALLLATMQTGLRLAEVTGLLPKDVVLGQRLCPLSRKRTKGTMHASDTVHRSGFGSVAT